MPRRQKAAGAEGARFGLKETVMDGRATLWRIEMRGRARARWNVRRQIAEARIRREIAWLHGSA
ncbi:MAG: hypothetical protein ACQEUZ_12865 [Pseudomonadota bacterium]